MYTIETYGNNNLMDDFDLYHSFFKKTSSHVYKREHEDRVDVLLNAHGRNKDEISVELKSDNIVVTYKALEDELIIHSEKESKTKVPFKHISKNKLDFDNMKARVHRGTLILTIPRSDETRKKIEVE